MKLSLYLRLLVNPGEFWCRNPGLSWSLHISEGERFSAELLVLFPISNVVASLFLLLEHPGIEGDSGFVPLAAFFFVGDPKKEYFLLYALLVSGFRANMGIWN